MKSILTSISLLLGISVTHAAVQSLPFYDGFTYNEGQLFTVGSGVWDVSGGATGAEITVSNAFTLTAPAGLTNSSGKGVKWTPSGTARRNIVQFSAATNGTLYASLLINVVTAPSDKIVAYFDDSTSQPSSPQLGLFAGNGTLGISKNSGTPGATVPAGSGTHFVVVRYTFTGTTSDQVDLWVDPASATFGAVSAPASSATTSGTGNPSSIPYFGIYAASGAGPTVYLDEVRIGTNWASVTPTGSTVTPPPVTPPYITQKLIVPQGFVLRGTNGTTNGIYTVLCSSNIALPLSQWSAISTQSFNASGNFDSTNPIPSGAAQQFYRLLSGVSSNPPSATTPSITSQPQNQQVLLGQAASFSVTATGTAPLRYQWFFNTNSPIANATNSTYLISSVASNNVGSYSVTVTNTAGATNSSFATLTLTPAPVAPSFTSQPQNVNIAIGQSASFNITATGTSPLRYQWFFNTNSPIANATNATYSISSVASNNAGIYSVTVTNSAGATNSAFATLSLTSAPPSAPSITSQPQNQNVIVGQAASFSVVAASTAPLNYQWFYNTNTLLANATNATFTINSATTNDAGAYSVTVTNGLGATNSTFASLTVSVPNTNGDWFVSPAGNDSNPGTIASPFATLNKAITVVQPGQIIFMRGGTYLPSATINITNSGTALARIQLLAYPGETPYLNFTNQPYGAANRGVYFRTNANYWTVKGLEIGFAGDNGIKVEGSHHRFEQCVLHNNGDTGIQIGFGHTDVNPGGQLAAFIEVVNCDSYLNFDSDSNGGDADGFAAKMHCGQGIVFTGCRAWENSDDGWDLFETDYSIVISNCWTWKSGVAQGNGNGFKLGGNGAGGDSKGTHYAYNCVAFGHKVNGFTQNSHKDGNVVINCLSFTNGASGYNYFFEGSLNSGKQNVFKNNVGIRRNPASTGNNFIEDNAPLQQNNTWNLSVTPNSADYVSILETAAKAARQPDGSLPTGFARLTAGSDLIDKGVDVSLPFTGTSPDLGPYEYP